MNDSQILLLSALGLLLSIPILQHALPASFLWLFLLRFRNRAPDAIQIGPVRLTDKDRVRHTHIVGATGAGKTVLLETLIYEDLRRGRGAFVIDPKGDRELFLKIKDYCQAIGRSSDLHLLSANYPSESVRWNPCRLGSVAEIHSKLMNAHQFSEVFYQKACENSLLLALKSINKPHFHLPDIVAALADSAKKSEYVEGLRLDLSNLIESEWAEQLSCAVSVKTQREVSLLDITRKNEILFVDLPTEGKAVENGKIGKLLLQELLLISGLRKIYPDLRSSIPFSIFVDEFDAFATESTATLLNKGRSSNFLIHFAHQTQADIKAVSEHFFGKITGNMNVRFIFRQDDPESAEYWATLFGTKDTLKRTYSVSNGIETGEASMRETKEFLTHPDEIKNLGIGECIVNIKSSGLHKRVKIPLPSPEMPSRPKDRSPANYQAAIPKSYPMKLEGK